MRAVGYSYDEVVKEQSLTYWTEEKTFRASHDLNAKGLAEGCGVFRKFLCILWVKASAGGGLTADNTVPCCSTCN